MSLIELLAAQLAAGRAVAFMPSQDRTALLVQVHGHGTVREHSLPASHFDEAAVVEQLERAVSELEPATETVQEKEVPSATAEPAEAVAAPAAGEVAPENDQSTEQR